MYSVPQSSAATYGVLKEIGTWVHISSVSASVAFLIMVPLRLRQLKSPSVKIKTRSWGLRKIVSQSSGISLFHDLSITQGLNGSMFVMHIVCFIAGAVHPTQQRVLELAQEGIHTSAVTSLCLLSLYEHRFSPRPSDTLIVYLSFRAVAEAWFLAVLGISLRAQSSPWLICRTLTMLLSLITEALSKEHVLRDAYKGLAPEEKSSIWSRVTLSWMIPFLLRTSDDLTATSLPVMPSRLESGAMCRKLLVEWDKEVTRNSKGQFVLITALIKSYLPDLLSVIPARLFLIVFRYAQPILIGSLIRMIQRRGPENFSSITSCLVLSVAAFIYLGQAVSIPHNRSLDDTADRCSKIAGAVYYQKLNRLRVMARAALVGLIYNRTLDAQFSIHKDYKAVTLMSTDVDSVATVGEMVHEIWAQLLEVVIGMSMLSNQVGWFSTIPLPLIFGKSFMPFSKMYVLTQLLSALV